MAYDSAYRNLERQYQVVLPDTLGNPALGFRDGCWFRISSTAAPEAVPIRSAILQCPAAAGSIVQIVCWWMREFSQTPRALDLATELAMTVSELARSFTGDPLASSIGGPIAGSLTGSIGGSRLGVPDQGPDQSRYDALADPLNDPLLPPAPVPAPIAATAATTLMPALTDYPGGPGASGSGWPRTAAPPAPRPPAPPMPAPAYRDEQVRPGERSGRYPAPDPYGRGEGSPSAWFRNEDPRNDDPRRDLRGEPRNDTRGDYRDDDLGREDGDRAPWRDRGPRGGSTSGRYDRPMPEGRPRGVPSAPPRADIPVRPIQQRPAPRREW